MLFKDSLIQINEVRLGGERRKVVARSSALVLRGFAARSPVTHAVGLRDSKEE